MNTIGRNIRSLRKKAGMTQEELAEKLSVTSQAVSKWETGRAMPDSSIMIDVCDAIGISVTELLSGERIVMDDMKEKAEAQLLEMKRRDEEYTPSSARKNAFSPFIAQTPAESPNILPPP